MSHSSVSDPPGDFVGIDADDVLANGLWNRFELCVNEYASNDCVNDREGTISYAEVFQRVLNMQRGLTDYIGSSDQPVLVVLECDRYYVTLVMALIRHGISFIPIDPALSSQRLCSLMDGMSDSVVITDDQTQGKLSDLGNSHRVLNVRVLARLQHATDMDSVRASEICQILTSGTTGEAKRVIYTEKMILHDVAVRTNSLAISPSDRFSQWLAGTSLPLMTLFLAILNGACLCCLNVKTGQTSSLANWIDESKITILRLTPTLLRVLAGAKSGKSLQSVRLVSCGGEGLFGADVNTFRNLFRKDAVLVNHLSATEYRVACQYFIHADSSVSPGQVPVGTVLPGFDVKVIDDNGIELARGECGEIIIISEFVSPGYFDAGENDWVFYDSDSNGNIRIETGDLGCIRQDGVVEHLGRKDNMLKIKGQRVQVDALEAAVSKIPGVDQVCAIADCASDPLVVLCVSGSVDSLQLGEVRKLVYQELGLFGFPQRMERMTNLPMTANGKVDRALLSTQVLEN